MSKTKTTTTAQPQFEDHEGMNRNTDLCVDLKTFLRHDRIAQPGKGYEGRLMRDEDTHFTFVEGVHAEAENAVSANAAERVTPVASDKKATPVKRNPIVISGNCVNLHRKADGSFYLAFRFPVLTEHYTWKNYCIEAAKEILSLSGLGEEKHRLGE